MKRFSNLLQAAAGVALVGLTACSGVADSAGALGSRPAEQTGEAAPAPRPHDPTASRVPNPSKSLQLAADWRPAAPTRTALPKLKARVKPSPAAPVAPRQLSARPSDAEFRELVRMHEPLRPVPGASSDAETEALASAIRTKAATAGRELEPLEQFLSAYPSSRWAPVLHLNLGRLSYAKGYFQAALDHYTSGWLRAKSGEDRVSKALANAALAEAAKMNARVGRKSEVESMIADAQARTLMGDARVQIGQASEGAWMMNNHPELSFLCGPYALANVANAIEPSKSKLARQFLDKQRSPTRGFSIPEVQAMGAQLGVQLQIAKRAPGAPPIVPSVVHWKLGHFGALVREARGHLLLKDPTFGEDAWITAEALNREASGYFLVPAGPLPTGWASASSAETRTFFGKGFTGVIKPSTADWDHQVGGSCQGQSGLQMAVYRFHTLDASVHIEDTPVGYTPAFGPDIHVRVAYNARQAGQPAVMDYSNFGPNFHTNWFSSLKEDQSREIQNSTVGGNVSSHIEVVPGIYPGNPMRGERMYPLGLEFGWEVRFPDGHKDYYEHYLGGGTEVNGPPAVYTISRVVDPQGNAATIEYDATYTTRIKSLVDATGLSTDFNYDYPGEPYLVTSIEDPFGRTATFSYAPVADAVRLQSIEDTQGIISSFTYNEVGEISTMSTPYGTTRFELSPPYVSTAMFRFAEATDPLGQRERVEFNIGAATGIMDTLPPPLPDSSVAYSPSYNNYRNSFYWDKLLMKEAPGNYAKARIYHWLHQDSNTAIGILESEASPLEGRVFYNYPDQPNAVTMGSIGFPSVVGRVVKNAAGSDQTQATQRSYNDFTNLMKLTDPAGRETAIDYASNNIDVTTVKQRTGTSGGLPVYTTLASIAYAGTPPHRPSSVTDGAGQTTSYTYNSVGQVLTIENAKSETTTFAYETSTASPSFGRLLSVTGDVPGGNRSFTYDVYGRVATSTNSDGHVVAYDYDNLDRVRVVTYPDGSFEQLDYEDHSLVATRDREGRWTRHMYNGLMQRVVTQDPAARTTQFQWCRCGELRRFVDGNGNITEWQRDEGSRVTKKILADGLFDAYTYDLSGRVSTHVDPMLRTTTYKYNVDDRLAKIDYSEGTTPDVTFAYDAYFPRVTSRVDGAGTTSFAYHDYGTSTNGAGQIARVDGPLTDDTLEHTYDQLGRLKKLEIVDDATHSTASWSEELTFDSRGRVTSAANNLGTTAYAYVGQSARPSTIDAPNGMQTAYDYFGTSGDLLLKQIKNLTVGPSRTVISQFDYTYRPDRSVATWKEDQGSGARTWTFGYDGAQQLTKAERRDASNALLESRYWGYDGAGNRVQVGNGATAPQNYATNNLNQLLTERDHGRTTFSGVVDEPATVKVNGKSAKVMSTDGGAPYRFEAAVDLDAGTNTVVVEAKDGRNNTSTKSYSVTTTGAAKSFEYDANGNLRFEKQPGGTVIREYRWDQQNRLVRMLEGAHESVYEYDGESRRVRIKELTSSVETKNETFVWCGETICQKRASNGTTVLRSYFGQGFEQNGPTDYVYARDHLGSVREVVASDGTTVASRLSYDPWGNATESGSGAPSDFTYTGHHMDRATGLLLPLFRAYDASLGRWLSRDPIGISGGSNLYRYVQNNPALFIDPDGRHHVTLQPDPISSAGSWMVRASDWNFGQAASHWDSGNYGNAALHGYYGASLAVFGAVANSAGDIIGLVSMARGTGFQPHPDASGPHSTFTKSPAGRTTGYATWDTNPHERYPSKWIRTKRVDTQYANPHDHDGVKTPHVHESCGVRPAGADELPP